jgi:hypothetical protein
MKARVVSYQRADPGAAITGYQPSQRHRDQHRRTPTQPLRQQCERCRAQQIANTADGNHLDRVPSYLAFSKKHQGSELLTSVNREIHPTEDHGEIPTLD